MGRGHLFKSVVNKAAALATMIIEYFNKRDEEAKQDE